MADTQRSRSAILTLFADNVTGQISAQDLRDFVVTLMEENSFQFAGDFWAEPTPESIYLTDRTGKGWKMHSIVFGSEVSFGDVVYLSADGYWRPAHATVSDENRILGMAMESYAAADEGIVLRDGLVRLSEWSALHDGNFASYCYLGSVLSGAISAIGDRIVGYWEHASAAGDIVLRFRPDNWPVTGA